MSSVMSHILVGFSIWLLVFSAAAVAIRRRQSAGPLLPSYSFRVLSIAMLALAPLHSAYVYWFSEGAILYFGSVSFVLALFFAYLSHRAKMAENDLESAYSAVPLREKFAVLFVSINCVVFSMYFADAWGLSLVDALPGFIGAVVLLIVLSIIGTIAITLSHAPITELEEEANNYDVRDKKIGILAARNAYFVIAPALVLLMLVLAIGFETATVVHLGLATLVLTELVKYCSQIFYYQFGE